MIDYSKPLLDSNFNSVKVYIKGDCKIKIKTLTYVFYTEGKEQWIWATRTANKNWKYPVPESVDYSLLEDLCWFTGGVLLPGALNFVPLFANNLNWKIVV